MDKPKVEILPSIPEHVALLKDKLRPADKQEILNLGLTPTKALWRSYKGSVMRKTAFIDGEIGAMWGVGGSLLGEEGRPFLLTSGAVHKVSPLYFARLYQAEVYKMLELFPKLVNYVDIRYTEAVRLLDIIGFELGEPEAIAPGGMFIRFSLKRTGW